MIPIFHSAIRKDERIQSLVNTESFQCLQFHQKCLDRYVHPKTLERFAKGDDTVNSGKDVQSTPRSSSRKRNKLGNCIVMSS